MTVRALGAFEVSVGGQPLALAGAKQRAVLAVLALDTNRVVPVGRLLEAVWGEAGDGAEHTLQQHVSALRKLVDPDRGTGSASDVLVTQAPGYLLRVDESDVEDFERAASAGFVAADAGRGDEALAAFDTALGHWRGPAVADLRGLPWFDAVAVRLEERRLAVVEARIDIRLRQGGGSEVVGELGDLTRDHAYHERFWAQLMLALYRSGRQADALAAYQRARRCLVDELGIEPNPALRDLEAAILAHDPALESGGLDEVAELHETFRTDDAIATGQLRLPDGQVVALVDRVTLIGRNPEAQVRLVDSRVSRRHAQIESADGAHLLRDLGSTNGTTVNGQAVSSQRLEPGDVVGVGGVELVFAAGDDATMPPR